jgi:hypothetical protein
MIPPELSQELLEIFHKHCHMHSDKSGNPWYYTQNLQKAIDAVAEHALRYADNLMGNNQRR